MKLEGESVVLRVLVDSFQKWHHRPVYEVLVERARTENLAGATVFGALEGFALASRLLRPSSWGIGTDREMVVEILDTEKRVESFLRGVEPMLQGAIVTLSEPKRSSGERTREHRLEVPDGSRGALSGVPTEGRSVKTAEQGTLLRIFVSESDHHGGSPLYEAILARARERNLAGATVFRGIMGYGRHCRVHTAKWEALSTELPIVVEIVDAEEKIQGFLPLLDELVEEGLVTVERVGLFTYGDGDRKGRR